MRAVARVSVCVALHSLLLSLNWLPCILPKHTLVPHVQDPRGAALRHLDAARLRSVGLVATRPQRPTRCSRNATASLVPALLPYMAIGSSEWSY